VALASELGLGRAGGGRLGRAKRPVRGSVREGGKATYVPTWVEKAPVNELGVKYY